MIINSEIIQRPHSDNFHDEWGVPANDQSWVRKATMSRSGDPWFSAEQLPLTSNFDFLIFGV